MCGTKRREEKKRIGKGEDNLFQLTLKSLYPVIATNNDSCKFTLTPYIDVDNSRLSKKDKYLFHVSSSKANVVSPLTGNLMISNISFEDRKLFKVLFVS